ncbi:MAG: cation diffusion facilitator family transporter [Bacteroidales bacterium]|nr:cation diffusion facilitator family transporter [Bacteroidales bacterium]MCF8457692.1 cation diffusion facilitator family transporter [Bacteroidales bacterium]
MERSKGDTKKHYAYVEGWLSLIGNIILFAIKLWAGIVSNSVALIADAWHTLSDSVTSVIVLVGTKISAKPPDEEHPFGHGRSELIASIIIGVLLVVVAFSFVRESIVQLSEKESANFGTVAIVVTIISIVSKEIMAQLAIRYGKKVNSQPMIADGWHHRSDALSSVVILVGILIGSQFWWVDAVLGIAVGLLILVTAVEVLKNAINPLIGEAATEELLDRLIEISKTVTHEELHIHHIHVHTYGDHVELTFHIRLPGEMMLEDTHSITRKFVQAIREDLDIQATIYVNSLADFVKT